MKKPPFNQLRGTVAQKYRHRIALGATVASFGVCVLMHFAMTQFTPLPPPKLLGPGNYERSLYHMIPKIRVMALFGTEKKDN